MSSISVADAALELQVSDRRVRQLIERGDLRAERFGRQWLVYRDDVADLRALRRVAGRPFSPPNAWGILALAEGRQPEWLSVSDTKRLSDLISERGLAALIPTLRRRAEREAWYVHPSLLDRLGNDSLTVRSGVSAVAALISDERMDVYAPDGHRDALAAEYFADTDPREPNVVVRFVSGEWPFASGQQCVGAIVAAVDLMDHASDSRCRRVADELLAHA
jgi:excisionase family DNA binding protein